MENMEYRCTEPLMEIQESQSTHRRLSKSILAEPGYRSGLCSEHRSISCCLDCSRCRPEIRVAVLLACSQELYWSTRRCLLSHSRLRGATFRLSRRRERYREQ